MAPSKPASQSNRSGLSTMVTRMRAAATTKNVAENNLINKNKRKAETALTSDKQKRSAFGDLTNVYFRTCPESYQLQLMLVSFVGDQ